MTTYNFLTATSINVLDGPTAASGLITSDELGPITFLPSDNPTITDSSDVGTTLVINNPASPAGLTNLTASLGGGSNTVNLAASSASLATSVLTGSGDDTFNVALSGLGSALTTVRGGGGANTLNVDANGVTGLIPTAPGVIRFTSADGVARSLAYEGFAQVTISGNFSATPGVTPTVSGTERQGLVDAITSTFTSRDPLSTASDFTATIDWGDSAVNPGNNISAGTITEDASTPGVFYVTGSHSYPEEGTYNITTTIAGPGTTTTVVGTPTPPAVSILGAAQGFAILGGSTVTNTGVTAISGDVGVSPGTAITGFPPGTLLGGAIHPNDPAAVQAQAGLATAYTAIANEASPLGNDLSGQDLGGLTLHPGVYHFNTSAQLTGQLILDAQGDPNARFDFQVGTTLTTAAASSIVVINGGNPDNVYFQVGTSATLGTATRFQGNILANASITLTTGASIAGRALAITGAVTLDTDAVTIPAAPTAGGTVPVTIINTPGTPSTATATATIEQAALLATASPVAAVQGQPTPANLVIATFTDTAGIQTPPVTPTFTSPGDFSATIDFGDGSPAVNGTIIASAANFQVLAPAHTYAAQGRYTVTVRITENDVDNPLAIPETVVAVGQATVAAVAPVVTAAPPLGGVEGAPINAPVATFTDADPAASTADFAATIDWGDGIQSPGVISQPGGVGTAFSIRGVHAYTEESGLVPYVVTVSLTGPGQTRAAASTLAVVADAPLINALGIPVNATEGVPLFDIPVARFTDVNPFATASDFTATIDWGDGTPVDDSAVLQATGGSSGGSNFRVLGNHTYANPGSFPITIVVTDKGGSTATIASSANNAASATVASAPIVGVQGATFVAVEGLPATGLVATFTDTNTAATAADYAGTTIDWGDGTSSPAVVTRTGNQTNGSFLVVSGTHTYAEEGNFPIRVAIVNPDGTSVVASSLGVVSDAPLTAVGLPVAAVEGTPLTNVPVAMFTDANPNAPLGDFAATIDWGDGTPATVGAISQPGGPGSAFTVSGSHTYDNARVNGGSGTYTITTRIVDRGGSTATATGTATVADVPIVLSGRLNPASDSGLSDEDGITNDVQPAFAGSSEPFSTIRLGAVPFGGGATIPIGSTTADASGAWSLTSTVPLADGSYIVLALATDRSGFTTALQGLAAGTGGGPLVIDTVGPKVTDIAFDRLRGRVTPTFQDDRSGLDQATVIDGKNYSFQLVRPLPGQARLQNLSYRVTRLQTSPQVDPKAPQVVEATINRGGPIRGGFYRFTIRSGGIEDVAGNALDGEFYGYVPSGNNRPGGDFVADLNGVHNVTLAPLPDGSSASPLTPPGRRLSATRVPTIAPSRTRPLSPSQQILDEPNQAFSTSATAASRKSTARSKAVGVQTHDEALAQVASR